MFCWPIEVFVVFNNVTVMCHLKPISLWFSKNVLWCIRSLIVYCFINNGCVKFWYFDSELFVYSTGYSLASWKFYFNSSLRYCNFIFVGFCYELFTVLFLLLCVYVMSHIPWNPIGYIYHHLPSAHTLCLRVLCCSQNKQQLFPYVLLIEQRRCVFIERY